ncbi:enolase C-terminal domain-like protein [Coleofasciculus sp.]|uniref:enolase C-terminal domain-like protein n=1 Tax=Coleofasciculus sp. TaxID=3100458 RepID=UPI0039F755C1
MSTLNDFLYRRIHLYKAEFYAYVNSEIVSPLGVSDLIRQRRNLPRSISSTQIYLHLKTWDGIEGWFRPLSRWSNVRLSKIIKLIGLLGRYTSIADAVKILKPFWFQNSTNCAAIDCVLWDIICREEGLPLWRVLSDVQVEIRSNPPFYGSVLGLSLQNIDVLTNVFADNYPLAKWTLDRETSIDKQISEIMSLNIALNYIALDAHGSLELPDLEKIFDLAPNLAWLEDPFPSDNDFIWNKIGALSNRQFPPLVVGEDISSIDGLNKFSALSVVQAVNIEVERLGITRSVLVLENLKAQKRRCHLHGRSIVLSSHLSIAYPEVVFWVEVHLAFALERLITIHYPKSDLDPRNIVCYCLEQMGIGVKPTIELKPSVFGILI